MAKKKKLKTRFGRWLERHKIGSKLAAQQLKSSRMTVWLLATGQTLPGIEIAHRIEKWTRKMDAKDVVVMQSWV